MDELLLKLRGFLEEQIKTYQKLSIKHEFWNIRNNMSTFNNFQT